MTTTNGDRTSALEKIEAIRRKFNVKQMLDRPFFRYIAKNKMTKDQMREFFQQYYVIVQTSSRMLAAGILSTPQDDIATVSQLVRFLETESGGTPNHAGHYYRWTEAFGVSQDDLKSAKLNKKSRFFEDTLMGYFHSPDSVIKQAAQFGTEDCAEVLIDGLDKGFKKFTMSARTYGYLAIHRLLENDEEGHSRWAIDALAASPDFDERIKDVEAVYKKVFQAFSGVFNGVYEAWNIPVQESARA